MTIQKIEGILDAGIESNLVDSFSEEVQNIELKECFLILSKEEFERMSTYKLTIKSKSHLM